MSFMYRGIELPGKKWHWVVGILFIIAIALPKTPEPTKTPEQTRKAQIEHYFSQWDGSHNGLTAVIKKSMNDPDSYKHVETTYGDKGDYLIVSTTFRGKNAFGGVVTNTVVAKTDLKGNVIKIISGF